MAEQIPVPAEAQSPIGINHLVLNVRDIEESHKFWTEIVGLKQVATLRQKPDRPTMPKMRFYSAVKEGQVTHHTVALVESPNLPAPSEWVLANGTLAINHVALTMPDRDSWLKQLAFLQSRGVKFNWRVNHGVTHSVYINDPNGYGVEFLYELPREMWENDIQGAIDYIENLPSEGAEALLDRTDSPSFGQAVPAAEERLEGRLRRGSRAGAIRRRGGRQGSRHRGRSSRAGCRGPAAARRPSRSR